MPAQRVRGGAGARQNVQAAATPRNGEADRTRPQRVSVQTLQCA